MNKLFLRKNYVIYYIYIYVLNYYILYSTCFSRVVLTNVEM